MSPRWWPGLAAVLCLSCADPVYVMFEEHYTASGQAERYIGGGCMAVESGSSSASGSGAAGSSSMQSYSIEYVGQDEALDMTVRDGAGQALVEKTYSEEFLLTGEVDEIVVELGPDSLRLLHWGGEECVPPREPPP